MNKEKIVKVCDLTHKHETYAVETVTIDVCNAHAVLISRNRDGVMFECEQCGKSFRSKAGLAKHITDIHVNGGGGRKRKVKSRG